MKQPYLIECCLQEMSITEEMNIKKLPATKHLLHKDKEGYPIQHSWYYRTVIGLLNYLKYSTRLDLAMRSYEVAVRQIGKYLIGTTDKGTISKPDNTKGLECYVDVAFAAGWQQADTDNTENFLSKIGYVIYYTDCQLLWKSKLQTEIL